MEDFNFEETPERVKLTIPVRTSWLLLLVYSVSLVIWLIMLIVVLVYLILGQSSSLVLTILLLIWMVIWFGFGRFLWTRWQYQAARREILFFEGSQLIIRRPVSILGLTTSYDLAYISPFYYSDQHACPAFDYAFQHVYFGHSLNHSAAVGLIDRLNEKFIEGPAALKTAYQSRLD